MNKQKSKKAGVIAKANYYRQEEPGYVQFQYNSKEGVIDTICLPTDQIIKEWLKHQTIIDWEEEKIPKSDDDFDI